MNHRLSVEFHHLAHTCQEKDLTLKELVGLLHTRTQALITLVLSLPFVLFVPIPGLSILFGIFICFNGIRIAKGTSLWFPRFLLKRKMSGATLAKGFRTAARVMKRAEKLIKPRGKFLVRHPHLQILHGVMLAVCGFFLALPLPPGTNFLPGLTTALVSIGIMEEDGLFIVLSYIFFVLTLAFFTILPFYGIQELFSTFKKT
ncbi:MAG: exopolysaccharide biosynthesis protein [Chlamydiales bacterium]|nr:exopolysaccharide biosynthesis protein [Chlamydiales bacterium]